MEELSVLGAGNCPGQVLEEWNSHKARKLKSGISQILQPVGFVQVWTRICG